MHRLRASLASTKTQGMQPNTSAATSEASQSQGKTVHNGQSSIRVALQDFGAAVYKSILALVTSSPHPKAAMLRAHKASGSVQQNTEKLQPKTSEVAAGTLVSTGGHRLT